MRRASVASQISRTARTVERGVISLTHLAARHFALFSFAGVFDPSPPFVAEPTLPSRFATAAATGTGASSSRPGQQVLLEALLCLSELHKLFRLLEFVVPSLTGPSAVKDGHGDLDRLRPESRNRMVELSRVHDRGVDSWFSEGFLYRSRWTGRPKRFASGEMGGEGADLFRLGGRLVGSLELVQQLHTPYSQWSTSADKMDRRNSPVPPRRDLSGLFRPRSDVGRA